MALASIVFVVVVSTLLYLGSSGARAARTAVAGPGELVASERNLAPEAGPSECEPAPLEQLEAQVVRVPPSRDALTACVRLNVVDAETRIPLSHVDVIQLDGHSLAKTLLLDHPGAGACRSFLAHCARSPVELPVPGPCAWWVGSPGFAWQMVQVGDPTDDPELLVPLVLGGAVTVRIIGASVPDAARIRVRPHGARALGTSDEDGGARHRVGSGQALAIAEQAMTTNAIVFDGLPVGCCSIAIELGSQWDPLQLGEAEACVQSGCVTDVTLVLNQGALPPPQVRVAGTVHIPAEWGSVGHLTIEPTGIAKYWSATTVIDVASCPWATSGNRVWDAGSLQVGQYVVRISECGFWAPLNVGPRDNRSVHFEVAPPCEVVVRFVDADSHLLLAFDPAQSQPGWSWCGEDDSFPGAPQRMVHDSAGVFVCKMLPGMVRFCPPNGYLVSSRTEVQRGRNDITVSLRREFGVEIVLEDGDLRFPGDGSDLHNADGSSACVLRYASPPSSRLCPAEPGAYTLVVEAPDGYEAIANRDVIATAGNWLHLAIPLKRRD